MKILFFARDPGGANAVIPVAKKLKDSHEIICFAKDVAVDRMINDGLKCQNICEYIKKNEEEEVYDFLEKINPDVLVTGTSLDDYTERFFWKAARRLEIPSVAIIDQWMNLGIRFSKYNYTQMGEFAKCRVCDYVPDKICVPDNIAKEIIVKEGVEESKIYVTGQPHFDVVKEKYDSFVKESKKALTVIFVSEPISKDYDCGDVNGKYWGFNEYIIFDYVSSCLEKLAENVDREIEVVIRPHPRENVDGWQELIDKKQSENIKITCDNKTDTFTLLERADLICGMSSMFLLEAIICKIPTLSIVIGLKRENPFILDRVGLCRSVRDEKILYQRIEELISKRNLPHFKIIENATENVVKLVCE